jgi:hypothetical protein
MVAGAAFELQINSKFIAARQSKEVHFFIHTFHFTLNEYCENGNKTVKGNYRGIIPDMEFPPLREYGIDLSRPGLPNLLIGPFDHSVSRMRYRYSNGKIACEWYDDETWKECGECRATLWSGSALDCVGVGGSRVTLYFIQKLSLTCRRSRRWTARLSSVFRQALDILAESEPGSINPQRIVKIDLDD